MVRERSGLLGRIAVQRLQRARHAPVQRAALRRGQLGQHAFAQLVVSERPLVPGGREELRVVALREPRGHVGFRIELVQQRHVHVLADDGGELEERTRLRGHALQPVLHHAAHTARHQVLGHRPVARVVEPAGALGQHPHRFHHEERIAFGFAHEPIDDGGPPPRFAEHLVRQRADRGGVHARECDPR